MMIDRPTGESIARLMSNLRPDWDYPGCVAAVKAVARKHPADVGMAAIRLAMTPEAKTPMALSVPDGAHWRERIAPAQPRTPPKKHEQCRKHSGEWSDACRCCAADKLAGTDTENLPERTEAGEHVQRLRLVVRESTAELCSHGVAPRLCVDHRPEPEASA